MEAQTWLRFARSGRLDGRWPLDSSQPPRHWTIFETIRIASQFAVTRHVERCGTVGATDWKESGSVGEGIEVLLRPDKFRAAGFTPLASECVLAPRVKECPVHLEARVSGIHLLYGE